MQVKTAGIANIFPPGGDQSDPGGWCPRLRFRVLPRGPAAYLHDIVPSSSGGTNLVLDLSVVFGMKSTIACWAAEAGLPKDDRTG